MIAYNKQWLYNIYITDQAGEAYYHADITEAEKELIAAKHPYLFYTPNIFVRAGLFLLTSIISILSIGLFSLPFISGDIENIIAIIAIITGLGNYAALEFFTRKKHHFNSGVDHALMLITGIFIITGINILFNVSPFANAFIVGFITIYFAFRFSDAFMGILAFCCIVCLITFGVMTYAPALKYYLPFILIGWCVLSIMVIKKTRQKTFYRHHYSSSLLWLEITAAIGLYAFGNYYVVKEIGNDLLNPLAGNTAVPFAYIFWMLTIIIPCVYLAYGISKKNILYIRLGLVCIVAMAVTIRYYYNLLPAEILLTLTGIGMAGIAWILIRYLKKPRNGYTSFRMDVAQHHINLESLIIIESFGNSPSPNESQLFQGGSGGGGGASTDY